jgi:hypothetical protein
MGPLINKVEDASEDLKLLGPRVWGNEASERPSVVDCLGELRDSAVLGANEANEAIVAEARIQAAVDVGGAIVGGFRRAQLVTTTLHAPRMEEPTLRKDFNYRGAPARRVQGPRCTASVRTTITAGELLKISQRQSSSAASGRRRDMRVRCSTPNFATRAAGD